MQFLGKAPHAQPLFPPSDIKYVPGLAEVLANPNQTLFELGQCGKNHLGTDNVGDWFSLDVIIPNLEQLTWKYRTSDISSMGAGGATISIVVCAVLGLVFSAWCTYYLSQIKIDPNEMDPERMSLDKGVNESGTSVMGQIHQICTAITEGANAFLFSEYKYMGVFMLMFATVICLMLGLTDKQHEWSNAIFSTLSFLLGCTTSIVSGYIGMKIAVYSNGRTALQAAKGYPEGFATAIRGGIVMGFGLSCTGLIALFAGICLFKLYFDKHTSNDFTNVKDLFGGIAAFGLGGSSIAMFGRVGGGIFTKAADVGADLVGKIEQGIPEDDPRNPGVIADCIGDNVGDIAGMGSDLFGSFAEASCAALVIASTNMCLSQSWSAMMYPLVVMAYGIIVCALVSLYATNIKPATSEKTIEPTLKNLLVFSTILGTGSIFAASGLCLPSSFYMQFMNGLYFKVHWWECAIACCTGLWAGLGIGFITEYYTSNNYSPVAEVAEACTTGAATNIIYGLALGYLSVIVPTVALSVCIYVSYNMCSVFGIAMAALGILSTMSIGLTIDAYGPISDNAGGIAEMAGMGEHVRERTDALDAAGNTTAAIGKGYAIGSAALVGLALYGAFLTRAFVEGTTTKHANINVVDPRVYFGLLVGAMIPYWFSAMTMKSVGIAAMAMVREIQHQFHTNRGIMEGTSKPDYKSCVTIATDASLKQMLAPGALVVITPLVFGVFFGPEALAGLLPGSLVSGVQMAISASNTGGAWDNAKKYVEAGNMGEGKGKGSDVHTAAVIGDTVGDPLKDTSGPALNIVVKLMAIISVVFAPAFHSGASLSGLIFDRLLKFWAYKDSYAKLEHLDMNYQFNATAHPFPMPHHK